MPTISTAKWRNVTASLLPPAVVVAVILAVSIDCEACKHRSSTAPSFEEAQHHHTNFKNENQNSPQLSLIRTTAKLKCHHLTSRCLVRSPLRSQQMRKNFKLSHQDCWNLFHHLSSLSMLPLPVLYGVVHIRGERLFSVQGLIESGAHYMNRKTSIVLVETKTRHLITGIPLAKYNKRF